MFTESARDVFSLPRAPPNVINVINTSGPRDIIASLPRRAASLGVGARALVRNAVPGGSKRAGGGDGGGNWTSLGEGVRREREVEDRVILLGNRSSIQ